jgi:hypothetical protein
MSDETKPGADIVADAREWLARYGGRETTHSDGCHRWHDACLIARLVAECERLRDDWPDQLKSAHSEIDRLREANATLTDAEREAVEVAAAAYAADHGERFAATLRGLLSRTGSIGAKASDETTETNENSANVPERDCFGSAANSQPIRRDGCGECLTESEREAVEQSIDAANGMILAEPWAIETLRKMLARLSPPAT